MSDKLSWTLLLAAAALAALAANLIGMQGFSYFGYTFAGVSAASLAIELYDRIKFRNECEDEEGDDESAE